MKLTISAKLLLSAVKNCFSRSSTIPVTEFVLLRSSGSQLSVTSMDFSVGELTEFLEAEVHTPGSALVKHQQLKAALTAEQQDVVLELKDTALNIKTSRGSYKAPILPTDLFPLQPEPAQILDQIPAKILIEGVTHSMRTVVANAHPPYRNNLFFDEQAAVGIDPGGRCMSVTSTGVNFKAFSLPSLNAKIAAAFGQRAETISSCCLRNGETIPDRLLFQAEGFEAWIHLDDRNQFTDWRRLPKQVESNIYAAIVLNPKEMLEIATRISHFSEEMGKETVIVMHVSASHEVSLVTLNRFSSGNGSGQESIQAQVTTAPMEEFQLAFSFQLLSKVLSDFECEQVTLRAHDLKLCSFRETEDVVHYLSLIMV